MNKRPHYWHKGHRDQVLALLAALDLDPEGVTGIMITIRVGEISRVEIERQIADAQMDRFTTILKGYREESPFEEDEKLDLSASDQAVQKACK